MPVPGKLAKTAFRLAVAVLLGPVAGLVGGAAALASVPNEVFIEVTPSTVEAGEQVALRASCPDNSKAATVRSDAFGRVTVEPHDGLLTRTVTISKTQEPRTFTVRLTCPGGQTATATLHVVSRTRPSEGPATGFGGTAGAGSGRLLIGAGLLAIAAGVVLGVYSVRRRAAG